MVCTLHNECNLIYNCTESKLITWCQYITRRVAAYLETHCNIGSKTASAPCERCWTVKGKREQDVMVSCCAQSVQWRQNLQTWAEKWGTAVPPFGGAGSTSNTMSPGPRLTSIPSGILVHRTAWPQYTDVIDRHTEKQTDRQRSDRTGRTVLQTAAQKLHVLSLPSTLVVYVWSRFSHKWWYKISHLYTTIYEKIGFKHIQLMYLVDWLFPNTMLTTRTESAFPKKVTKCCMDVLYTWVKF